MPQKAESAVKWAGLLLLTTTFFSELQEEINQTTCTTSKSFGSIHCCEVNIYIINPKLKGNSTWE